MLVAAAGAGATPVVPGAGAIIRAGTGAAVVSAVLVAAAGAGATPVAQEQEQQEQERGHPTQQELESGPQWQALQSCLPAVHVGLC